MKYYSEKLDKLFDTEADLQKAESESVSSDPSMKESTHTLTYYTTKPIF